MPGTPQDNAQDRPEVRPVYAWRLIDGPETKTRYNSIGEANRQLGASNLWQVLSGRQPHSAGCVAVYADEPAEKRLKTQHRRIVA